jgi:hypothetical protein
MRVARSDIKRFKSDNIVGLVYAAQEMGLLIFLTSFGSDSRKMCSRDVSSLIAFACAHRFSFLIPALVLIVVHLRDSLHVFVV